jgi:hypothetical protein
MTGLSIDTEYQVHIVLRTSAGTFESNALQVRTHTMENLTGINVSFGQFEFGKEDQIDGLVELVGRIGATCTDDLTTENTHLGMLPRLTISMYSCKGTQVRKGQGMEHPHCQARVPDRV